MGVQICLPGTEAATSTTRSPAAYAIVRCACGTRVVLGREVTSVACPKCRQIVSGVLARDDR
jgi:hypothetical protein